VGEWVPPVAGRSEPIFLNGNAWERTADRIQRYDEFDTRPSWVYLESDLAPGHEFTFPIVGPFYEDTFVDARILPSGDVVTPAGSFHAVECVYLVDLGVIEMRDPFGNRYRRNSFYGAVAYAPSIGPVASYEWRSLYQELDFSPFRAADFAIALKDWVSPASP
jgi:hypothetical protein